MKKVGIMRFVLLGVAGFGIGGAMIGAIASLRWFAGPVGVPLLVVGGAIGGASLGLALEDRRKTIALTVLGAGGFAFGIVVAFILGFLGFVPQSEPGSLGAMGVIAGAIGGASLGLALWDWKKILPMTLAGAVGLGGGIIVVIFSRRVILGGELLPDTPAETIIVFAVTGAVAGASLGATLGYLQWAAHRPRGLMMLSFASLASVPLVGGLFFVSFILPSMSICGEEERAALSEFPQYGGAKKEPQINPQSGGCAVFYDTSDPPEKVAAYLAGHLEEHGWEVEDRLEAEGNGSEQFGGTLVTAYRDGLRYDTVYESLEFYDPPRPGTHVAVHVSEGHPTRALSCGSEEKAALAEFPHYGGKELGEKHLQAFPLRGETEGACVTGYPAKGASREEVSAYYEEKLKDNGWNVEQSSGETRASRDRLRYVVHYWRNPGATEVEVRVFRP